jgi:SAM-dependent methyltransferase
VRVAARSAVVTLIRYGRWDEFFQGFIDRTAALVAERESVCEVGAGARPMFPPDVAERYLLVDIDAAELAKAPDGYETAVADLCAAPIEGSFDLVFSYTVVEHIADPASFHQNVAKMLKPGGIAFHCFPTLYAIPFVLNRILPDALTELATVALNPKRARGGKTEKFPAFYRWCRGPSAKQIRRFESLGYDVAEYAGFFGTDYLRRTPLQPLVNRYADLRVRYPSTRATAYAWVMLRSHP